MIIKSLKIYNFLAFGDVEKLDIPEFGVFQVVGEWNENKSRSNQAGKSSFVESMIYALYGKTRTSDKGNLVNFNSTSGMYVRLNIQIGEKEISIIRGKERNGDSIFSVSGYEGYNKNKLQGIINDLIGMTYEDFSITNCFIQGEMNSFMYKSPSEKRDWLVKWMADYVWDECEEEATEIFKSKRSEVDRLKIEIESSDKYLKETEEKLSKIKSELEIDSLIEDLKEKSKNTNKDLSDKYKQLSANLDTIKQQHRFLNNQASEVLKRKNQVVKEISEIKENISEALKRKEFIEENNGVDKIIIELEKEVIKIIQQKSILASEKDTVSQQLKTLKSKLCITCPVDEKDCDGRYKNSKDVNEEQIESFESIIKEKRKKYSILSVTHDDKMIALNNARKNRDKVEKYKVMPTVDVLSATINELESSVDQDNKFLEDVKPKIENLSKQIKSEEDQEKELKNEINRLENLSNSIMDEIGELKTEKGKIKSYNVIIEETKDKIKKLNKDYVSTSEEMHVYSYLKFMFGKRGIQMSIVKHYFSQIETTANFILSKISPGMQIEILSEKKLKSKEDRCPVHDDKFIDGKCKTCGRIRSYKTRSEININIINGKSRYNFLLDSGGGKALVSIAIRLALSLMVRSTRKSECRVLMLDEIFGQFDIVNQEKVFRLISDEELMNELGFSQVFLITHTRINESIDNVIKIVKGSRYSEVKIVE